MNLNSHINGYEKLVLSILLVIGMTTSLGCNGYDPCSKIQKGQECSRNTECIGGESCWCGWCVLEECTGVLEFADYSLESSIRNEIHKPSGDIRREDVIELKVLHGGCSEDSICIGRLDGIQCLSSLQELYLSYQSISDVSYLSKLTGLLILDIGDNVGLSDISPLSELNALTELNVASNEITDIEPLASLTNMTELNISDNGVYVEENGNRVYKSISDIAPLSGMTSLLKLDISWCRGVSDLTPLSNMTLLSDLNAEVALLGDVGPLSVLTELTSLNLSSNEITDITPLVENPGIGDGDEVSIMQNPIDCLDQASNIQALRDRGVILDTNCP